MDPNSYPALQRTLSCFEIGDTASTANLRSILDQFSSELLSNKHLRHEVGKNVPMLWKKLQVVWAVLADYQCEPIDDDGAINGFEREVRDTIMVLARFTRNICAGASENQDGAFDCGIEAEISKLLLKYTSWISIMDSGSFPVTRLLVQALSNMVTMNEKNIGSLWDSYMHLTADRLPFLRLLTSPDNKTVFFSLVMILNCVHDNQSRLEMLCNTTTGVRLCRSILDCTRRSFENDEAKEDAQSFDIGYSIIVQLIEGQLISDIYSKLAVSGVATSPNQTTLLRLIESYLQSQSKSAWTTMMTKTYQNLLTLVSDKFLELSPFIRDSLKRLLASEQGDPEMSSEAELPATCQALVFLMQCIISIALRKEHAEEILKTDLDYLVRENKSSDGLGLIENIVELLRFFDQYLPRIFGGKPVQLPSLSQFTPVAHSNLMGDAAGFAYLKRDLVRVLGIFCYNNKAVQDRVRAFGGIPVVMNLCVVDERNPYLREHAILTLHNLLSDNPENKAAVSAIQPTSKWNQDGTLVDINKVV